MYRYTGVLTCIDERGEAEHDDVDDVRDALLLVEHVELRRVDRRQLLVVPGGGHVHVSVGVMVSAANTPPSQHTHVTLHFECSISEHSHLFTLFIYLTIYINIYLLQ